MSLLGFSVSISKVGVWWGFWITHNRAQKSDYYCTSRGPKIHILNSSTFIFSTRDHQGFWNSPLERPAFLLLQRCGKRYIQAVNQWHPVAAAFIFAVWISHWIVSGSDPERIRKMASIWESWMLLKVSPQWHYVLGHGNKLRAEIGRVLAGGETALGVSRQAICIFLRRGHTLSLLDFPRNIPISVVARQLPKFQGSSNLPEAAGNTP